MYLLCLVCVDWLFVYSLRYWHKVCSQLQLDQLLVRSLTVNFCHLAYYLSAGYHNVFQDCCQWQLQIKCKQLNCQKRWKQMQFYSEFPHFCCIFYNIYLKKKKWKPCADHVICGPHYCCKMTSIIKVSQCTSHVWAFHKHAGVIWTRPSGVIWTRPWIEV